MADLLRRMVSGNKARFRDEELDMELDLAYITDRVIVMGYPSKGIEGFYRNRREDAKKFLEHRHGKNFWVFNFCPVQENSYSASFFDGRVSRYPFPDHHAPPLAILPLVAREMRTWLDGSPDRVAVLHCKAGKGRSGTMACSYLLTLSDAPKPPSVGRSRSVQEKAKQEAERLMNSMPADIDANPHNNANGTSSASTPSSSDDPIKREMATPEPHLISGTAEGFLQPSSANDGKPVRTNSLQHVLELHTAGRMKRPSSPSSKVKNGVSIPSQRRWLYYWSLLIAHQGPQGFWSLRPEACESPSKIQLVQIKLRMKELSPLKANLVKAANAFIDKTGKGKILETPSKSHAWVSLAKYDDVLVEKLEWWERMTRSEDGEMGLRKPGSEHQGEEELSRIFADDTWDREKMVKVFARFGAAEKDVEGKEDPAAQKEGRTVTYTLRPLSQVNWESMRADIEKDTAKQNVEGTTVEAEEASIHDVTNKADPDEGIILDANREVRIKLYIGQVFMGWFWFIPAFHMTHSSVPSDDVVFHLTRAEVDFPLGIGANIVDIDVTMKWSPEDATSISPLEPQDSPGIKDVASSDRSTSVIQATPGVRIEDAGDAPDVGKD